MATARAHYVRVHFFLSVFCYEDVWPGWSSSSGTTVRDDGFRRAVPLVVADEEDHSGLTASQQDTFR